MSKTPYRITSTLTLTGMALFATLAPAAPDGGQISAGSGAIVQAGAATTVTQHSQNLAIDWNSFSIAANESVRFNQPNASAIALNRVLSASPSQISGSLSANGQVFILNPNGVLFGQGAQVNVGGLVASTLTLSNADFMAGNYRFSKGGTAGAVVNQGTLTAANGGYIALLAPEVRNEGVIVATLGTALMAAGDKVTLNLDNGSLLGYSVDQGALNALAENKHLIQADGGQVILSARAADQLAMAVVNNTGIIEARTLHKQGGVIKLLGDMRSGTVSVGGTLDASAPNGGDGGFIETSAAHVNVANNARITTLATHGWSGTWLLDPVDFTIAATGGDMTGAAVGAALAGGNFTILSSSGTTGVNGDIFVNDVVSWSANKLTLNAHRNININANLNGSGTAQLALEYGQGATAGGNTSSYVFAPNIQLNLPAGGNFSTKLGSDGNVVNYTVITSLGAAGSMTGNDMQGMNGNLAGNYVLGADIDASPTSSWNLGAGFAPVGNNSTATTASQFTGVFDGLGHTIINLVINRPTASNVGLFGYTAPGSIVRNAGLVGGSVIGSSEVGGLVGYNSGSIINSYATGNVSSSNNVAGGLAGYNSGTIGSSYASGSVSGSTYVGGLVGTNYGTIGTAHASGNVSGTTNVGGLVGYIVAGTISNSYATGNVSGDNAGGLVGVNSGTTTTSSTCQNTDSCAINLSYASGNVNGSSYIGGLVGISYSTISKSYSTGSVSGSSYVGGLVGYNASAIKITYSTGSVSGSSNVGGFVGYNTSAGIINASYWDTTTSTKSTGIGAGSNLFGVTGLTTAQMMTMASFTGWSIANTGGAAAEWRIYDGYTYPLLTSFLKPQLIVTANNANKTYDGAPYSGGNGVTYSDANAATNIGGIIVYSDTSQGASNAGSYIINISTSGLYSRQQGYDDISYVNSTLTITPYAVSLSGSRTYDGTSTVDAAYLLIGPLVGTQTLNISGSGSMNDKHAGTGKAITSLGTLALADGTGLASNYTLVGGAHAVTINAASLAIDAVFDSKAYDGTTTSAGVVNIGTLFGGDTVTGAIQAFASKNVLGASGSTLSVTGYTVNDGNGGANYTVTSNTAPGTITAANLAIDAVFDSKAYDGTTNSTAIVNVAGLMPGDTVSGTIQAFGSKNVMGPNGSTLSVIGYTVYDGNNGANYIVTNNTAPGTITPALLTVTANSNGKVIGDSDPVPLTTVSYSGFKNGETSAALGVGLSLVRVAGETSGTYAITASGYTPGNYTYNYVQGNFIIAPAGQLLIVMENSSAVYGVNPTSLLFAPRYAKYTDASGTLITNLVASNSGTDNIWTLDDGIGGGASFTASTSYVGGNVGSYLDSIITGPVTPIGSGNYSTLATVAGTLTITPLQATLATTPTKVYDGTNVLDVTTLAVSNKVGSDVVGITGIGAYANQNVGSNISYSLSTLALTGASAGNYYLPSASVNGTDGIITPAPLTVTANAAGKVYGAADPVLSYTAIGFKFTDTATTVLTGAQIRAAGENVGSYAISKGTLASNPNYTISYTGNNFGITPAALTVSANAANKMYGGVDPALTYTATGFKFADTTTSVMSGALGRVPGENAGSYAIGQNTLAANANYAINYTGNNLVITPAPLTIIANNTAKTYGQTMTFAGTEFINSVLQNGETIGTVTLTSPGAAATANVAGSPYAITASAATGGTFNAANYAINYVDGALVVNPASLTVAANNATKTYGLTTAFAGTEFTATGLQNGETIGSVSLVSAGSAATADMAGNPYAITASGATGGTFDAANYTINYVDGVLTVNPANPAAVALGNNTLVLAYNTAQQGIANTAIHGTSNPAKPDGELISLVNCGVMMPPDAPANTCQN